MEVSIVDFCFLPQQIFERCDHGVHRNRLIATTKVDDFVAHRFECRNCATGNIINVSEIAGL